MSSTRQSSRGSRPRPSSPLAEVVTAAARVGGGTIELAPVPKAPEHHDTVELRLALVCYGGVSLAIYMHGVTKEIQKLVAASKAYEEHPDACPPDLEGTERSYWEALNRREDKQGPRTRVVVDIIAGTSAGGINGIILAKALAHDLPQDALREVWLERGDLGQLMALWPARKVPFVPSKVMVWGAASAFRRVVLRRPAKPPLDGDRMFTWIHEALQTMDGARGNGGSLMPPMHQLELYVTMTDFHGYNRRVPTYDPQRVSDLRHRHVLVFRYGPTTDQLDAEYNPELAFAARATSCFPGAFPPINLANIEKNVPGWQGAERFKEECWRIYTVSGAPVEKTHFVDGGVLDNYPLLHAIEAIRKQPAALQVDRQLVYIDPDPKGLAEGPTGEPPTLVPTIWGGLSGIARHEPVLDDLLTVRELNERIERVREIVHAADIPPLDPPLDESTTYAAANTAANEEAAARAGFAYTTYIHLKLHSVVERFSAVTCEILKLPLDSNHAFFVRDVLLKWARKRDIFEPASPPSDAQRAFLKDLDLDYGERRIRFAIDHINQQYDGETVPREQLNEAKRRLYEHLGRLAKASADVGAGDRGELLRQVFSAEAVQESIDSDDRPEQVVADFVREASPELEVIESGLRGFLQRELGDFGATGYETLLEVTDGWDETVRRELLERYLRFPLWDVLVFPVRAVSDIGELNPVEVVRFSPEDVSLLRGLDPREPKLKGVAAGHFAAFFKRDKRENDYLWGRLDGAERILQLLVGKDEALALGPEAFNAILDEESGLEKVQPLMNDLRDQVARLGAGQ
jgi:patatin-related protein